MMKYFSLSFHSKEAGILSANYTFLHILYFIIIYYEIFHSYSFVNYHFKKFKFLHIVPVIQAIGCLRLKKTTVTYKTEIAGNRKINHKKLAPLRHKNS